MGRGGEVEVRPYRSGDEGGVERYLRCGFELSGVEGCWWWCRMGDEVLS